MDFIRLPEIRIYKQQCWEDLNQEYLSAIVIKHGTLNFTKIYFYLAHTGNRSAIVHSLVAYLTQNRAQYAKRYNYDYQLLKAALLEGFFGIRESLAGTVNCVFYLDVEAKLGSTRRILKEAQKRNLKVADYLDKIVNKNSPFDKFLEEFRHPYVHREDISGFSVQDLATALAGMEQPRILTFIDSSAVASQQLQEIEKAIAMECGRKLGIL